MSCTRHSTVCPTNRSGSACTSAAVTPTMAPLSLGARASAGNPALDRTLTMSPARASTRAGRPALQGSQRAALGAPRPAASHARSAPVPGPRPAAGAAAAGCRVRGPAAASAWTPAAVVPGLRGGRLRLATPPDGSRSPSCGIHPFRRTWVHPPLLAHPLEQRPLAHPADHRAVRAPAEVLPVVRRHHQIEPVAPGPLGGFREDPAFHHRLVPAAACPRRSPPAPPPGATPAGTPSGSLYRSAGAARAVSSWAAAGPRARGRRRARRLEGEAGRD